MTIFKMSRLIILSRLNSYKNAVQLNRILSTQTQTQIQEIPTKPANVSTRVIKKSPNKPPFMKNIFVGIFDTDLLAFPEVLDNQELKVVEDKVQEIDKAFSEIDTNKDAISREVIDKLKDLKLFGLQASALAGGLELSETENIRILESVAQFRSLAVALNNHQYLGVNAISAAGSPKAIEKYLHRLSNGDTMATFCLLEDSSFDPLLMKTKAILSEDGTHWILNGSKAFVINASNSDVLIVVAHTADPVEKRANQDPLSVFIVEKSFPGISITLKKSLGFEEAQISSITFDNTPVPLENILGKGGDSIKILTPLLSGLRLSTGPNCIAILHDLIKRFADYSIRTKHGNQYISETDAVKDKLAKIHINLYAIESITYMTAGLLDKFEDQDCTLESTIVKVFSSEKCVESVLHCMKLIGSAAYLEEHWLNSMYNDSLGHILLNETNDALRIVISLVGLQFSGMELNESVKKIRNPFFNPGYVIRRLFQQRRQAADDPKLSLRLEDYLHPSLTLGARSLEYSVYRLQYATESLLFAHGPEIIQQHMELLRLADVAMDVYAMVAVLARASRSYCIGLQNTDAELLLANSFCIDARTRVKEKVGEIRQGKYGTNDKNYQAIAKRALKWKGYFAEHALTKNF